MTRFELRGVYQPPAALLIDEVGGNLAFAIGDLHGVTDRDANDTGIETLREFARDPRQVDIGAAEFQMHHQGCVGHDCLPGDMEFHRTFHAD